MTAAVTLVGIVARLRVSTTGKTAEVKTEAGSGL